MRAALLLGGGAPVIKRYMAGETIALAGQPVLGCVDAGTAGELASVTAGGASAPVLGGSQIGLSISASGTIAATGITDNSELFCDVIVNPNLVIGARASGDTTQGTALTAQATTGASATGVVATGVTTLDNGWMQCVTGANTGQFRRTDDAVGGVAINFINAIATGDTFVAVQCFPCNVERTAMETLDLTTDLTEIDATTAVIDMENFCCFDINTEAGSETTKTEYLLVQNAHYFGSSSIT